MSRSLGLDKLKLHDPRALIAADLDNDLAADLLVTQREAARWCCTMRAATRITRCESTSKAWLTTRPGWGRRSRFFPTVRGRSGKSRAAGWARPQPGATEVLAGLGQNANADIVRMLWPTGVLQDEIDVAANKPVSFLELDRRGSSCPTLFAWNGEKYEFITDVIGAA